MTKIVLVRDPDSGFAAFYVDGKYVTDFYDRDPFEFGHHNDDFARFMNPDWEGVLEELFGHLGMEFEVQSRFQPLHKLSSYDYGEEWEEYWPENLEDCPWPPEDFYGGVGQ